MDKDTNHGSLSLSSRITPLCGPNTLNSLILSVWSVFFCGMQKMLIMWWVVAAFVDGGGVDDNETITNEWEY